MDTQSDAERDTINRDETARLNSVALGTLMAQHRLYIPARDFPKWRPTKTDTGSIPAVCEGLTIIATDGILGYFLTTDGETFIGHVQRFTGDVKTLYTMEKQQSKKPQPKKARPMSAKARAKALLEAI